NWNRSRLLSTAAFGAVHDNTHDPGLQQRTLFEAPDAVEHAKPGFLHHLFRDRMTGHVGEGDVHHLRLVAVHELRESILIARAQSEHELQLVGWQSGSG